MWVCIYLHVCTPSSNGCVYNLHYVHTSSPCGCVYIRLYAHRVYTCGCIDLHIFTVSLHVSWCVHLHICTPSVHVCGYTLPIYAHQVYDICNHIWACGVYVCVYVCIYIHTFVLHVHMCVCLHTCMPSRVYVCTCLHVHTLISMCVGIYYIYTHHVYHICNCIWACRVYVGVHACYIRLHICAPRACVCMYVYIHTQDESQG